MGGDGGRAKRPGARTSVVRLLAVALALSGSAPSTAQDGRPVTREEAFAVLQAACSSCHGAKKQKAGVDFSKFGDDVAVLRGRKLWRKALEQVTSGAMPPEDEKPLPPDQKRVLASWMKQVTTLDTGPTAHRDPGPALLRRLTLGEYTQTLQDLCGLDFDPSRAVGMTEEYASQGFNNMAAALGVTALTMEKYFAAADALLEQLFCLTDPELIPRFKVEGGAKSKIQKAYARLVFLKPGNGVGETDAARQILGRFMSQAYRRPALLSEVARVLPVFDAAFRSSRNFDHALRMCLKPVLVSPHFLLRIEENQAPRGSSQAYLIRDHELATRLSYFLWSTMPDEALTALADEARLTDPPTLEAQVKRLLADPKAKALTRGFFEQWLQLRKLVDARPSTEFYPAFTHNLRVAMREELVMFADKLREEDHPVLDFLDCDYTYANEVLAKHYGLQGVKGEKMVRVSLPPESHRGGLLGMSGMLAMTSHDRRTSPTLRGKWVLDVLFSDAPPPPPAVSPLKEEKDKKAAPKTFRERMALHAADPSCAGCHRKMDPLGYALENFDGIGGWRDDNVGQPLDTNAELASGEKVRGVAELKAALLRRKEEFVQNLVEQMLSYALGRALDYYDDAAVQEVVTATRKGEYRFSALVLGIVRSYPFQHRRNVPPAEE